MKNSIANMNAYIPNADGPRYREINTINMKKIPLLRIWYNNRYDVFFNTFFNIFRKSYGLKLFLQEGNNIRINL